MNPRKGIIVLGAYPISVVTFRGDLIRDLLDTGSPVTVMTAAASPEVQAEIEQTGATFRPYPIQRNGMNPKSDLATMLSLRSVFGELKPDVILAYTIKPIIWGGIAARRSKNTRFFALVTGLGYAFQGESLKRRVLNAVVVRLYRFALGHAEAVIFQNADNRDLFVAMRIVPESKCHVVSGSGINTSFFSTQPFSTGDPRFLLIARLLGEKGIREYVAAAEIVKKKYPAAIFDLVGPEDPSPDGIPYQEVRQWHEGGAIWYHGAATDVRPFVCDCHVYVLPSYHEGMPRTVLEAMSMGRPILTTDVVGCRETVVPGRNGWLVPKADAEALAERMIWFIEHRDQWAEMGAESRRLAEDRFDVRKVNAEMLRIMGIQSAS
ncbi:glycosyltransferase family 4 protein [Planctomycetes bacterium K23_9]|uniref:N, N'-diacetylbacillosaminyl-diphospho-undecaprenol alpha-1,3-N-acetylgalactosaminyltransferase n=1 Tax=Stieleria marina TaxID=1930275 RepID=A0A517NYR4_9BACT|nr:N,N'-diacetylbacillosaminyl-diphospho-undecaprenol alpha-1,3-N-acetylgalactosaminyltransferase [Planctomycetes bacterium K23_9]